MQKIMFNERYGLQSAVFEGRKTQTRREPFYSVESVCCEFNRQGKLKCFTYDDEREYLIHTSRYAKGEIVAVAQSYEQVRNFFFENDDDDERTIDMMQYAYDKGWNNKMFVKAELMPHHIRITNIRCDRLQDITDEDCIKEGVVKFDYGFYVPYMYRPRKSDGVEMSFRLPKDAFTELITKLNGKKFWDTNPYVIVYEFELVD